MAPSGFHHSDVFFNVTLIVRETFGELLMKTADDRWLIFGDNGFPGGPQEPIGLEKQAIPVAIRIAR